MALHRIDIAWIQATLLSNTFSIVLSILVIPMVLDLHAEELLLLGEDLALLIDHDLLVANVFHIEKLRVLRLWMVCPSGVVGYYLVG